LSRLLHGGRVVFLLLVGVAVSACLLVEGYSHREMGRAGTVAPAGPSARAALSQAAGPVLDLSGNGLRTARLADRTVALTFDDGPDPRWTPRLLSLLEAKKVPATFFVVGSRVLDTPGLVARERRDGDALGIHTFTHIDLAAHPVWQDKTELALTQKALAAAAGVHSGLLRPPYSSTPAAVTAADTDRWRTVAPGELVVLADRDSEDWQRPGVSRILSNATPAGQGGAIVMFHDGGGDRSQTLTAVGRLIDRLRAAGWRLVTVPQGLGISPAAAMPAAVRSSRLQGWALLVAERAALTLARVLGWLLIGVAGLSVVRAVLLVVFATVHARRRGGGRWAPPATPACVRLPPVSVVVPAYNEQAGIAATVRSVAASNYPGLEIVVVDDGSTDTTVEIVRGLQAELERLVLVEQDNRGKARALNAGIAAARGEVLVLVDGDTVLEADTVRRLVGPLTDPGVGAAAGNTKVGNRGGLLGRWQHIEYVVVFNLDRRLFDLANCMQTIPGAIGAFRRAALDSVGGVPTDTLAEDTDLTLMLGLGGWRVAYEGQARAWTEAPATLGSLWRQRYRWAYGTMQAAYKHRRQLGRGPVTGPAGGRTHLGRLGLPYLLAFGIALPLLAPLVDLFAVVGLLFMSPVTVAIGWATFAGVQFALAAYALHLDGERLATLWALPLQQIAYRQLMYLVVVQSTLAALTGTRLRWHKLARTGSAADALTQKQKSQQAHAAPQQRPAPHLQDGIPRSPAVPTPRRAEQAPPVTRTSGRQR